MAELMTELLKADASKADEKATGTFESKNLGKILGRDSVTVHIREISPKEFQNINSYAIRKDGTRDASKDMDVTGMICAKGVTDPKLTDKELQEHFKVNLAHELAWKLFKVETAEISNAILKLSGLLTEEDEEEILKNL